MSIIIESENSVHFSCRVQLVDDDRDVASDWAGQHIKTNKFLKWIIGRYVEADNANSNKQYWTLSDLQSKHSTVDHTPINMGHRRNEIVGTIVASEMIYPTNESAELVQNPFVETVGAFWKWYFPEQLSAIEKAYSEGNCWQSMESVSDTITCVGENGCGLTFDYAGPMSDTYCFVPETLVLMADGTRKRIDQIEVGDWVVTHRGVAPVTHLFEREYSGDLVNLRHIGSSEVISMTPNHPVRTFDYVGKKKKGWAIETELDSWGWTAAGELESQTLELAYPVIESPFTLDLLSLFPEELEERADNRVYLKSKSLGRKTKFGLDRFISLSDSLMTLAGLYAAEGSVWEKSVSWSLHVDEVDAHDAIRLAIKELDAGNVYIYQPKQTKGVSVRVTNGPLGLLLKYLCGAKSREKHLSSEIMLAPLSYQKVFYDWYCYGDGHFSNINGTMQIRTTSPILARNISDMALRLGQIPTIYHRLRQPGGPDNRLIERDIWQIQVNQGSRSSIHRHGFFHRDVKDVKITDYHGMVYNFEVEGDHSYVVENLVVHNCVHLQEHTASKQLNNPHFLGAGLIIPPDRPGWTNAEINELSKLTTDDEKDRVLASIAAESPHLSPKEWENLMWALQFEAYHSEIAKMLKSHEEAAEDMLRKPPSLIALQVAQGFMAKSRY